MEYTFLHFVSYKQQLLSLSNFIKQSQLNTISNKTLLYLVLYHMVFFDILTAEMVNDLSDTHHHKPKLALKDSKSSPLTHVIDNPLDDFLIPMTKQITLQLHLVVLHHHLFLQNNQISLIKCHDSYYFQNEENKVFIPKLITKLHSATVKNPNLPNHSTVITTPNDYSLHNAHANNDNDSPVKVYSKKITLFVHPLFRIHSFYFFTSVQYT